MSGLSESFLLKADIDLPNATLRALRTGSFGGHEPDPILVARAVSKAIGAKVLLGESAPIRGTFRWVVPVEIEDRRLAVARIDRLRHPAITAGLVREAALADQLVSMEVPSPLALAVDLSCEVLPVEFGVFERIRGKTLSDRDADEGVVETALRSLGAHLRRVHSVRLPGAGPVHVNTDTVTGKTVVRGAVSSWPAFLQCRLQDHLNIAVEAGHLGADEADRAGALFDDAFVGERPFDRLLHGDPGGPNVILDDNGVVIGLIDWEDALIGDPLFELASCACFHPERRWSALFEGYGRRSELDFADRWHFWLYFFRIALARTVVRYRFAIADVAGRLPAAHRIRFALDRIERETRGAQ